jgi:tetratricopeptide (TPR) repeat protein
VKESLGRHGIGKSLFDQVVRHAKENNCRLIIWKVLDWNDPAISFYKKAIRIEEENELAWYSLADCYAQTNKYQECIEAYERVIDEDPLNKNVWIDYGRFVISNYAFKRVE